MTWPDKVNGLFEACGGLMSWWNVVALCHDGKVSGVRVAPMAVFMLWGLWNLFYYPSLGQWASFAGGLVIVSANFAWVILALALARR